MLERCQRVKLVKHPHKIRCHSQWPRSNK